MQIYFYPGPRVPSSDNPFFGDRGEYLLDREQRGRELPPLPWFLEVVKEIKDRRGRKVSIVKIHPPERVDYRPYNPLEYEYHHPVYTWGDRIVKLDTSSRKEPHTWEKGICLKCGFDGRGVDLDYKIAWHERVTLVVMEYIPPAGGVVGSWDLGWYAWRLFGDEFLRDIRNKLSQLSSKRKYFKFTYDLREELMQFAAQLVGSYQDRYNEFVSEFDRSVLEVDVLVQGKTVAEKRFSLEEFLGYLDRKISSDFISPDAVKDVFGRGRVTVELCHKKELTVLEYFLLLAVCGDGEVVAEVHVDAEDGVVNIDIELRKYPQFFVEQQDYSDALYPSDLLAEIGFGGKSGVTVYLADEFDFDRFLSETEKWLSEYYYAIGKGRLSWKTADGEWDGVEFHG